MYNRTCMVWKTPNVTFNFYLKTKTLQVQGKAVDPIREILFQSLGHSHQDATADETVFGNEADNLSIDLAPLALISDGIPECMAQDDFVSVLNENAHTFDSASPPKHLPFGCHKKLEQLSEEIELLKQENRHYANQLQAIHDLKQSPETAFELQKKITVMSEELELLKRENCNYASQLQNANEEKQSLITSLRLLANELSISNRCQHESVDTRLLAENKSLQESINILNADNQLLSTKVNELSNRLELQVLNAQNQNQDQASDFVEVRSKKKKKKSKGSKSPQGQQAATSMDQEHQEHVAPQRNDTAVIIGDSIIKGLRNDLLSRATKRRVTVRSFPGASSSDMKHYLQPSLQLKPSEIILHAGTNDLRDSSSRAVAEKLVDLGNLISSSSPSTKVTISALTQRFDDESLGKKVTECNKIIKSFCNQNGWVLVQHPNIDLSCVNSQKLHLNRKGIAILASNFVNHLTN